MGGLACLGLADLSTPHVNPPTEYLSTSIHTIHSTVLNGNLEVDLSVGYLHHDAPDKPRMACPAEVLIAISYS
jgi:hypothetical protein